MCAMGFKDVPLEQVTLHVYSINSYKSESPWNLFGNIVKIEDGELAIKVINADNKPSNYYSLDGVRVAKPRKGVYIRNGKKVMINN